MVHVVGEECHVRRVSSPCFSSIPSRWSSRFWLPARTRARAACSPPHASTPRACRLISSSMWPVGYVVVADEIGEDDTVADEALDGF